VEASFADARADWASRLERLPSVEAVTAQDHVFRISTSNGPATTLALMEEAARSDIAVQSLSVQSTTLDDVFVHYPGPALRDELQTPAASDTPFILTRAA